MTLTQKTFIALFATCVLFFSALLFSSSINKAIASSSIFGSQTCYTAAATSTLNYMTAGLATTTVTCTLGNDGADAATLVIEVNASSTSVYNFAFEESMDGIDWYPISAPQNASTSAQFTLNSRGTATFTFASSTIGGTALGLSANSVGVSGVNNRNHYSVDIPVRMRKVRVYSAIAPASTPGAVWMQIIPKSQI